MLLDWSLFQLAQRGVRHPTSTFGARVGALNAGKHSLELIDSSSSV